MTLPEANDTGRPRCARARQLPRADGADLTEPRRRELDVAELEAAEAAAPADGAAPDLDELDLGDGRVLVPVLAERLLETGRREARRRPSARPSPAPARAPRPVPDRAPPRPLERPLVDRLPGQANWPLRIKATALGVLLVVVVVGNALPDLPFIGHEASPVALTATRWPIVRIGHAGTAVRTVQYLLVTRGYTLAIDGLFGPETQGQVRSFQRARGLKVDGIVGPQTWSALVVSAQRGLEGYYVRAVQSELTSSGLPTAVDGVFGPITEGNVRSFQRRNGLKANGMVGITTWNALTRTRPHDPRGIGFEPPAAKPKPNTTVGPPGGGTPGGEQPGTLPATD